MLKLNVRSWLIGKDPDVGKDWGQEEKGTTEGETTQRTWIWANSRRWWRTGKPGVLPSCRHDWATEQELFSDSLLLHPAGERGLSYSVSMLNSQACKVLNLERVTQLIPTQLWAPSWLWHAGFKFTLEVSSVSNLLFQQKESNVRRHFPWGEPQF